MKILSIVGARPNFVKIAPLINAINRLNEGRERGNGKQQNGAIGHVLVHTGQHYDKMMSDAFFSELRLPRPDIALGVGSGTHAEQTAEIMKKFEGVLLEERPDVMVVVGDVNSTLACTLVASKIRYEGDGARPLIAHVEAGLRSFDRSMPEEINRLVTDALSDLLFTPSEDADKNLLNEGVPSGKILRVGNIMIDTLAAHLEAIKKRTVWRRYGLREKQYAFVTIHRPGNVDEEAMLARIMACLAGLAQRLKVIFPVHPRTRKQMERFHLWEKAKSIPGLLLTDPLSYFDTIGLVDSARLVLTDSGGLQEESTFLRVPCLTLRPNTERPVTITRGTNRLTSVGSLEQDIGEAMKDFTGRPVMPELWDGQTGERIVQALVRAA